MVSHPGRDQTEPCLASACWLLLVPSDHTQWISALPCHECQQIPPQRVECLLLCDTGERQSLFPGKRAYVIYICFKVCFSNSLCLHLKMQCFKWLCSYACEGEQCSTMGTVYNFSSVFQVLLAQCFPSFSFWLHHSLALLPTTLEEGRLCCRLWYVYQRERLSLILLGTGPVSVSILMLASVKALLSSTLQLF